MNAQQQHPGKYAAVNGLQLYYEIHGKGQPLVLLHGGGSTIESTFGHILPDLAKTHQVIAVELQAHGRTKDIDRPLSFEQDADDVAALLQHLKIAKADIMGFSNGGTTALQIGIRHPQVVNKLIVASAATKRNGFFPGFFDGFENATLDQMPKPLHEAFLKVNPDPKGLQAMFDRDVARMKAFKDISDTLIKSIQAPVLLISGDKDVATLEHTVELARTLPNARLAILPCGHGEYMGEIEFDNRNNKYPAILIGIIETFLH